MANTDTRIQFTAQGLQDIKTNAIALLRDMVTLNDNYNKSTQKSLDILKEQISLLEKRNTLLGGSGGGGVGPSAGSSDPSVVTAINILKDEQQLDNSALLTEVKNIVELLKNFSLSGSISGTVGSKILSATINLGGGGGPSAGGGGGGGEDSTEGGGSSGKAPWTRDIFNLTNQVSGALKEDDYAKVYTSLGKSLGGSLAGTGYIGAAFGLPLMLASMGSETLIDMYDKRQRAAKGNIQLFGGTVNSVSSSMNQSDHSSLGFSYIDALQEKETLSKAYGKQVSDSQIKSSFLAQRGAGVDSGTIESILRLQRGSGNKGFDIQGLISGVIGTQGMGKDLSLLDEHLQLLVGLSEQQLQEYGKTNVTLNNQLLGGISKLSDDFKNPQVLQGVVQKVLEGSQQAKTPQFQALQYRVLDNVARENPKQFKETFGKGVEEAQLWDLTKIMKDPSNPLFGKYMTTLMNDLYKNLGTQNAERVLESQYGMSVPQIGVFTKAMQSSEGKGISLMDYNRITKELPSEVTSRAYEATTSQEKRVAETTNTKGRAFDDGLDKTTEGIIETLEGLNKALMKFGEGLGNTMKDLKDFNKTYLRGKIGFLNETP